MAWVSAAVLVDAATVLPLIRSKDWWIRWFDFPRVQIFVLGLVLIGLLLLGGTRLNRFQAVLFSTLLLAIGYQAYWILPYTRFSPEQVRGAHRDQTGVIIKLVTANVMMGNRQAEKYLQVLAEMDPDIILTTEADQWWTEKLKVLDRKYPYQVKYPLANTYGMLLHSKFPLINPRVLFLVEPTVPSINSGIRLPGDQVITIVGLHPQPPGPTHSRESTQRDAELILVGKSTKGSKLPVIVLGDLNDVAWSHTTSLFQKISGLLDPRIGRGMYNTFHADYPLIRFPLDHIFHSAHFKVVDMRRLPYIGSDHFPFYAALKFDSQKDSSQKPPAPKPAEKKEAAETLEEAFKKKPAK